MRDRGREGRIIPSEYMMNVVIGLKLTRGWRGKWQAESKSVRVSDSECHQWLSAAASLSLSILLPEERHREQAKRRKNILFSTTCFKEAELQENRRGGKEAEVRGIFLSFFFCTLGQRFPSSNSICSVHTAAGGGGGERMLNNVTECEEGEGGPNSQGE